MSLKRTIAISVSAALVLISSMFGTSSAMSWGGPGKPPAKYVVAVAMLTKCKNPDVYSNYSLGDIYNWKGVKPYLKKSTYYVGIMFSGMYSVVEVTYGPTTASLKIRNNGERFLRYVSGCPSNMKISYKYVKDFGLIG
jgi:hypothetical protein